MFDFWQVFAVNRFNMTMMALMLLPGVLVLSSCATLFNDKDPPIGIDSNPAGAEVFVNGNYVGTTPVEVKLTVRQEHAIVFRKEGYEDKTYHLSNSVGVGWIVLDILGGLVPIIVDAATGDWMELNQETVNVVLKSQDG